MRMIHMKFQDLSFLKNNINVSEWLPSATVVIGIKKIKG